MVARLAGIACRCPRGGMVDTGDLKSLGRIGRAGSSPAAGTILILKDKSGCEVGASKGVLHERYTRLV